LPDCKGGAFFSTELRLRLSARRAAADFGAAMANFGADESCASPPISSHLSAQRSHASAQAAQE